jgi:AcrR family transcriptional regulator
VGSVYQYFANKEAILQALGQRFLEQMAENTVAALQQELTGLSMREMVDRVVSPMIEFERRHPAFGHFTLGPDAGTADAARRVDREILNAIHALLFRVRPSLDDAAAWNIARVTKALYKGMSYLIHEESDIRAAGADLHLLLDELKGVMAGYLEGRLGG